MTQSQPEALRLAHKYDVVGFVGEHRFAQDKWCRDAAAELRRQHARIEELEAQLSEYRSELKTKEVHTDSERRNAIAKLLGLGDANFAWSYLHDQIKDLVKCEEELIALRKQASAPAPEGAVPQWDGVIKPSDFIVDTFRRGASGWVPKPDNCVRITHRPTGFFEEETAMRSVHANKAVAWQRLSDRLESLAAEPQPPDAAAPVELPKPVGWFHRHPKECKNGEVCKSKVLFVFTSLFGFI